MADNVTIQHPLPEEIKKMNRDETVCKFCGISYLIHNEIKALEDKLKAAEEELTFYRGMEGREALLKQQIQGLEDELRKTNEDLQNKAPMFDKLQNDLKSQEQEMNNLSKVKLDMDRRLTELTHTSEQYRLKHNLLTTNLPSVLKQLQEHRTESAAIRNLLTAENTVLRGQCRHIERGVVDVLSRQSNELQKLQVRLTELETATEGHRNKEGQLTEQLEMAHSQVEQLSKVHESSKQLESEKSQMKSHLEDVKARLDKATMEVQSLSQQCDQYKDQIKKHTLELDQKSSLLQQTERKSEENVSRLQKELADREKLVQDKCRELEEVKGRLMEQHQLEEDLRGRMMEQQRLEEEIQRKASASNNKTEELKQALDKVMGDITAMKTEREMMISAHQTQIEQLRESFKKKVSEVDKWPQKMEETLKRERYKHAAEMKALEEKLKEGFIMEIQIEKQKHQELLQKYRNDSHLDEAQVRSRMESVTSRHEAEMSELHRQLAENKARARETENRLREEISSLKNIIKNLELKLGKLDTGAESKVLELKTQLHSARAELDETKRQLDKQGGELSSTKEEETVRKECEERFELTEALSLVKEELLSYKKPPGGYGVSTAWGSVSSRGGSANSSNKSEPVKPASNHGNPSSSTRSEEFALYKKISANHPQPPAQPKEALTDREVINANSVYVGQEPDKPRTPGKGLKGASLTETRKRISNMLGRR